MTDPYRVLGVANTADDEAIRAAYESIATERDRWAHALFDVAPPTVQEVLEIVSADMRPGCPDERRIYRLRVTPCAVSSSTNITEDPTAKWPEAYEARTDAVAEVAMRRHRSGDGGYRCCGRRRRRSRSQ